MANRFWVGGGSANTWAATGNTNWATSSGAANNASVPGVGDLAIFDSNSGVGNSVIGANITVQGLDCTGGTGTYAGTITHNTSVTLTINTGAASSLRLTGGMTYTPASVTSIITLTHTSGTANITCAGQKLWALNINGAGGTTKTLDALLVNAGANAVLTVTSGIFDANSGAGGPYAITANIVNISPNNTRSFIMGGLVKIGGNATGTTIWNVANTGTLTFTKNSANIEILTPSTNNINQTFTGGGLTYNGLTIDATTNAVSLSVGGANTFSTLAIGYGWTIQITNSTTTTVSAAFTLTGTANNPICIKSDSLAANTTISVPSGACTLTWGVLMGVTGTGGATFAAMDTLAVALTNTGWSITPPADAALTPAGIATAVWQDATAGDFTVSGSIGKDLFVGGINPGAAGGHFIAGTNAATSITTALTANVTGNLSGSVGSVTGNVGGSVASVTGAVGSVTAGVTLAAGQKVDVDTIKTNPVVNAGTVTFPTGATLASTTNITAGTITTATNLTNAPTVGDLTAAMKASVTTAATAATPTAAAVTGAVGSVTGNVGGSVGSVTGAVGSVTGNVGGSVGSVVGAVGSVTARVTANTDQIAGSTTSATNLSTATGTIGTGTAANGGSTISIPTSAFSPAPSSVNQFVGRSIIFSNTTTTTALQGQAALITASTNSPTPTFTVAAMTAAPAVGDTFVIV